MVRPGHPSARRPLTWSGVAVTGTISMPTHRPSNRTRSEHACGYSLSSEFFAACSDDELAVLAETSYPLAFDAGESLVRQGEPSPDAFVIAEGTADVIIDGEVVATLGPDALVGERGVLTGTASAATVTATSHLGAHVLSTERLRSIMRIEPPRRGTDAGVRRTLRPPRRLRTCAGDERSLRSARALYPALHPMVTANRAGPVPVGPARHLVCPDDPFAQPVDRNGCGRHGNACRGRAPHARTASMAAPEPCRQAQPSSCIARPECQIFVR